MKAMRIAPQLPDDRGIAVKPGRDHECVAFVCGTALLCAVLLSAAPLRAEPETVRMRFGWEAGMQASVDSTRTRTRVAGERSTRSASSRYTLRVDAADENLRVRFTDPTFAFGGEQPSLPAGAQAQIMAQLAELMPDFIVARTGEFVGIHDLPAFRDRFGRFLAGVFPEDLDPRLAQQLRDMLTAESFLDARAAEQWNAIVGAWVGASFVLGSSHEFSRDEPIPVFPGERVRMNYAFAARRLFPCVRGSAERTCAELEMRSRADAEDTKRLIESTLAQLGGDPPEGQPVFRSFEVENLLRITTEPEGLVPHSYTLTKTVRGTLAAEDGERPFEQVDTTEVRYVYP